MKRDAAAMEVAAATYGAHWSTPWKRGARWRG